MSESRTYLLRLPASVDVSVELTGMTIDFDCRVGGDRCTNHGSTRDDSWSGSLNAGSHSVKVYPYAKGPGNYSLTVTATRTLTYVATPTGISATICDENDAGGESCTEIRIDESITVTAPPPAPPPPPPPPPPGPGGGTPAPTPSGSSLAAATSDVNCQGWNIDDGDGFDALRRNSDGTTRRHQALDIQVSSRDASFFALADGTITSYASSATCGFQIAVRLPSGGRHVYCHMDEDDRLAAGTEVRAGDRIGSYGPSGVTFGSHLHLKVTDSNDRPIDPVEAAGGESVMAAAGFTFNSSDAEHCAGE